MMFSKIRKILLSFSLVCMTLVMTGCATGEIVKPNIVGSWACDDAPQNMIRHFNFNADGTYTSSDSRFQGTYTVENDLITLQYGEDSTMDVNFVIEGSDLVLYYFTSSAKYRRE